MKMKRIPKEQRELIELLELDLLNYHYFLGIHRNKEALDKEIEEIVENLKKLS